jgi:hypothetical protein
VAAKPSEIHLGYVVAAAKEHVGRRGAAGDARGRRGRRPHRRWSHYFGAVRVAGGAGLGAGAFTPPAYLLP